MGTCSCRGGGKSTVERAVVLMTCHSKKKNVLWQRRRGPNDGRFRVASHDGFTAGPCNDRSRRLKSRRLVPPGRAPPAASGPSTVPSPTGGGAASRPRGGHPREGGPTRPSTVHNCRGRRGPRVEPAHADMQAARRTKRNLTGLVLALFVRLGKWEFTAREEKAVGPELFSHCFWAGVSAHFELLTDGAQATDPGARARAGRGAGLSPPRSRNGSRGCDACGRLRLAAAAGRPRPQPAASRRDDVLPSQDPTGFCGG